MTKKALRRHRSPKMSLRRPFHVGLFLSSLWSPPFCLSSTLSSSRAMCDVKPQNGTVNNAEFIFVVADPFYLSSKAASASTATSLDVVVGVAVAVTFLVLLNAVLLFCIVKRKTAKSSSASLSSSSGKTTAASTSEGKNITSW